MSATCLTGNSGWGTGKATRIQAALGHLPQVDLGKVANLKAALAAGELSTDSATLSAAMLTYHRGER